MANPADRLAATLQDMRDESCLWGYEPCCQQIRRWADTIEAELRTLQLYRKKALDWNAEADRYLAQRDALEVRLTEAAAQLAAITAEREAREQTAKVLIEGVYMDRSIVDFQRSCEVHIAEEQRQPSPDTALIALLCDAVRCSRELALQAARGPQEDQT